MNQMDETKIDPRDRYAAFFASMIIALVVSGWLTALVMGQIGERLAETSFEFWRNNIKAALFFGMVFVDPVGFLVQKYHFREFLLRAGLGVVFGIAAQNLLLTPLAGAGMSNVLQLLLAGLMIPIGQAIGKAQSFADAHSISYSEKVASVVLAITRLPDRVLFILLMAVSFFMFWRFAVTLEHSVFALAAATAVLTAMISLSIQRVATDDDQSEIDFQHWLSLDPVDPVKKSLVQQAWQELWMISKTLLPGAILFGGMIRLALDVLGYVYPDMLITLADPEQMLRTASIVAASGLGIVLFGMLAILVLSLSLLNVVSRMRKWSIEQHRENSFRLMRTLYFRQIKRV